MHFWKLPPFAAEVTLCHLVERGLERHMFTHSVSGSTQLKVPVDCRFLCSSSILQVICWGVLEA